jgi:hypothetical protein
VLLSQQVSLIIGLNYHPKSRHNKSYRERNSNIWGGDVEKEPRTVVGTGGEGYRETLGRLHEVAFGWGTIFPSMGLHHAITPGSRTLLCQNYSS